MRAVASPTVEATNWASRGAMGKPSLAIGAPKRAVSAAMRMSQQLAISTPAPMQAPAMRATMGTSHASMADRPPHTSCSWKWRNWVASKRKPGYSEMSPPAQNASPSPSISTQRSSGVRASASKTLRSCSHMARVMALSRPSWRSSTRTTPAPPSGCCAPCQGATMTSPAMLCSCILSCRSNHCFVFDSCLRLPQAAQRPFWHSKNTHNQRTQRLEPAHSVLQGSARLCRPFFKSQISL